MPLAWLTSIGRFTPLGVLTAIALLSTSAGSATQDPPSEPAHVLLTRLSAVSRNLAEVRRQATDQFAIANRLLAEISDARVAVARLQSERNELAAYCTGSHDAPEYQIRRQQCALELPRLDQSLVATRGHLAVLLDRLRLEQDAAGKLAAARARLHVEQRAVSELAFRLPGMTMSANCEPASANWPSCLRSAICASVEQSAARTRQAIEGMRRELSANQRELDHWTKLNATAQRDAVLAGVKFLAGKFAASGAVESQKLERLQREADRLARKYGQSDKAKVRAMYARELYDKVVAMNDPTRNLMLRAGAGAAVTAEEHWSLARNTLQSEFNLAKRHNLEIVALVQSSRFRSMFDPDGIESTEWDLFATLAEEASKVAGERLLGIEAFTASVAPSVRAFDFVRDSSYNALLSLLSTKRVLQNSDVAGDLAKASGVLQDRYEIEVLNVRACTT